MGQRVDFSANASVYDRRHGAVLPLDVARKLADGARLEPGVRVLDVGAGTGRVAIAFAGAGYQVTALDPAVPMLNEVSGKARERLLHVVAGEGARLPFAGDCFQSVIFARILYLMPDWKAALREACDVLKPGGCVFHEWGNGQAGEPWVLIREKLREVFQAAGVETPFHPGARSEDEVDAVLRELGMVRIGKLPVGPGPNLTLREFVERAASGEFSYLWSVPAQVQVTCIPLWKEWCRQTFDLEQSAPMPRELAWTTYRKA